MSTPSRVSAGIPTGGQFSGQARAESTSALQAPAASDTDSLDDRCPDCGQWTSLDTEHVCGRMTALASRMDEVRHKIDLANQKLARNGLGGRFEIEILDRRVENRTTEGGGTEQRAVVDYRLSRPEVKIGGWTFAGRLDVLADGTTVAMTIPGQELDGFRPTDQQCDHCETKRARNSTYLLRGKDGDVKQVGSNCLEAFTGIAPKGLWSLNWEPELKDSDGQGNTGGGWELAATPMATLRMALAVTENGRGYASRARAEYGVVAATGDLVRSYLWPSPKLTREDDYKIAAAQADSDETGKLADEVLEYARTIEGDTDYATNMRAMAAQEYLTDRHVALLASAVSGWHREKEDQVRKAVEAANPGRNEWISAPGEKIAAVPATVTGVRYIEGDYGTTTLISFRDEGGHTLKWFASGSRDVAEGDSVVIAKATIKGHDEYNGTKQTVLTRAKLEPATDGDS
ncbi:MAG: hypothetical protein M3Y35_04705 [Actinomycetota bacterium]|nr:hypothetical protein [Actinomycetota bacterium]